MSQPIYNLHNHTPFSDGAYEIDEICEAHLALDLPVAGVGISDHLFCTPSSREVTNPRQFEKLFAAETRGYVDRVLEARRRWEGKLEILVGCEVNWSLNKAHVDSIRSLLDGVDYILFECIDWTGLTQLANQAKRWPCSLGLAHADVAREFPNTSMDQVVRTMANARIFYEVNSKFLPLEQQQSWYRLLPKHKIRLTLGTDTHDSLRSVETLRSLHEFIAGRGLQQKLYVPPIGAMASS